MEKMAVARVRFLGVTRFVSRVSDKSRDEKSRSQSGEITEIGRD